MLTDFYVNDLIFCHDNSDQDVSVLGLGGFELHKWDSNYSQMLLQIPIDHQAISNVKSFDDSADSSIQTLGLLWHIDHDMFKIQYKTP